MKAIILAAGTGSRLRPLTDKAPKCLVPLKEIPLLEYQLTAYGLCGIKSLSIVTGYMSEPLQRYDLKQYANPLFESTNMVHSLFCAEPEFDDDLVISYGDIIFEPKVLQQLLLDTSEMSVVIDKGWQQLWQCRMENPLTDAESLALDSCGFITDIGRKPAAYADINGQYIGLLKFSRSGIKRISEFYHAMDKNILYNGKSFSRLDMTSFIQCLIQAGFRFKAICIDHGWLEVDTLEDLAAYNALSDDNELFHFAKPK